MGNRYEESILYVVLSLENLVGFKYFKLDKRIVIHLEALGQFGVFKEIGIKNSIDHCVVRPNALDSVQSPSVFVSSTAH